jgi:hypothetical protein
MRSRRIALEDGVLRIWRAAPGLDQRFTGTVGPDTVEGMHQLAEAPGEWQDDMKVVYRRRG